MPREVWATRIGLVLAMAGNAIGLGNFLRFPVQCAGNGGGAFMIPYFLSLFLLGIPLVWLEWSMGRYGGKRGHGTTPMIFSLLISHPIGRLLGLIGLVGPFLIVVYYIYVESWTLAYSFFSLGGQFPSLGSTLEESLLRYKNFYRSHVGMEEGREFLLPSLPFLLAFLITVGINFWILRRGVVRGIEWLGKFALPLLFILAIVLVIRVFTLGGVVDPNVTPLDGLNFIWEPNFSELTNGKVWLSAAGQIFFTLSVGMGAIQTYASYVKARQDIALSGLTSASLNETAEVVLGGSIAIPLAVTFFGLAGAQAIVREGAFSLGFFSLPAVFSHLPFGTLFGFFWFLLLFFAALTSSVALLEPAINFLIDELSLDRKKAVSFVFAFLLICSSVPIFFQGALDEMDFWIGTFAISLFAFIESVLVLNPTIWKKMVEELKEGALLTVPSFYLFILRFVTPLILFLVLFFGIKDGVIPHLNDPASTGVWVARGLMIGVFLLGGVLIYRVSFREEKQ